jgi:hypothetical protein
MFNTYNDGEGGRDIGRSGASSSFVLDMRREKDVDKVFHKVGNGCDYSLRKDYGSVDTLGKGNIWCPIELRELRDPSHYNGC